MKIGVVIFPGSNCDHDLIEAIKTNTSAEVVELWHKDKDLKNCDAIFLPGGFSYGDYLRSGAIAKLSPVMDSIIEYANKGGIVMGICNGFQILCESGLLPGALLRNENMQFICKNVYITPQNTNTAITGLMQKSKAYVIPIAHGEGRYYDAPEELEAMKKNGQILFTYCNENGEIDGISNPNGSTENIAGICNAGKNVFGMMPHPERAAFDFLSNTDGSSIFKSLEKFIDSKLHSTVPA